MYGHRQAMHLYRQVWCATVGQPTPPVAAAETAAESRLPSHGYRVKAAESRLLGCGA